MLGGVNEERNSLYTKWPGHDLAVDQWHFLPYLSFPIADVPTTRLKRLAILNLEGHDQKHTEKTRQKLSVHFDFFCSWFSKGSVHFSRRLTPSSDDGSEKVP